MTVDRLAGYAARAWTGGLLMAAVGDSYLRGAWWPLALWLSVAVLLAGWMLADVHRDRRLGRLR